MRPRSIKDWLTPHLLVRCLLFCALGLAIAALPASAADTPDWSGWHDDVEGLHEAIEIQRETGKPMFVYFYATWCNFCRQFERVLLTEEAVDDYLDEVIAVRINGERSRAELELQQIYGVRGFPALFMHSERTKTVSGVTRMERTEDGKARLLSGEDFVRELKNAASR